MDVPLCVISMFAKKIRTIAHKDRPAAGQERRADRGEISARGRDDRIILPRRQLAVAGDGIVDPRLPEPSARNVAGRMRVRCGGEIRRRAALQPVGVHRPRRGGQALARRVNFRRLKQPVAAEIDRHFQPQLRARERRRREHRSIAQERREQPPRHLNARIRFRPDRRVGRRVRVDRKTHRVGAVGHRRAIVLHHAALVAQNPRPGHAA